MNNRLTKTPPSEELAEKSRKYLDHSGTLALKDAVTDKMRVEIYENTIVTLVTSYKFLAHHIHAVSQIFNSKHPKVAFGVCPEGICREARETINKVVQIVAARNAGEGSEVT